MTVKPEILKQDPFEILGQASLDFATAPIEKAFNWQEFAEETDLSSWYLVCFRSTRKPDADVKELEMLDELAHQDAAGQPGFLFYYKGRIEEGSGNLNNMSFCMWTDRESARNSAVRTMHKNASAASLRMYERYILERYNVAITRGEGTSRIEFNEITGGASSAR